MKKRLLLLVFSLTGLSAFSQVILSVQQPASIAGIYNSANSEVTYATNVDWAVQDLTLPATSVNAQVVLAQDLSGTADSLMCAAAAASSLTGKIALLYRGICGFSNKALNAQNAGAIAVIVVNNTVGAPIGMAGGTEGFNVTIPVIMVSDVVGAQMKAQIKNNQTVTAYIGPLANYFSVDLGAYSKDIAISSAKAMPIELVADPAQFPINLGIKVRNLGNITQSNSTVNVTIKQNGTTIFNVNSAAFNLNSGDSVNITNFPTFSPASYALGEYQVIYTINTMNTDENVTNNVVIDRFKITNDLYSKAKLNASGLPVASSHTRSSNGSFFESCVHFKSSDSEQVGAEGLYFSASTNATDLTGKVITIKAYSWTDPFTSTSDPNYSYNSITEIANSNYVYSANLQQTLVYKAFATPVTLLNNQRYLFCIATDNADVFMGFDNETKYEGQLNTNVQPTSPIRIDFGWYPGFTGAPVAAIGVKTFTCPTAVAALLVTGDTICPGETGVFTANTVPNTEIVWSYSNGTQIFTGSTLTVPNLSIFTNYYATRIVPGCNLSSPTVLAPLVFKYPSYSAVSESVCGSSFAFNGNTFLTSGTYQVVIPNAIGCDSTITLNLTFLPALTGSNPQTICTGGSYAFNGNTYSAAGTYTDVLQSLVTGCDSIVTTTLTVVNSFNVSNPQTICQGESLQVGTSTYTTAGTYTNILQSIAGCDSTVTTILAVLPAITTNNPQSICQGESYTVGGTVHTTAGTYVNVLQATNGCDSTVTTILTVNPTYLVNNPQTICQGGSYSINGNTYTTAGTYTDATQTIHGCDTIVVTVLTVTDVQLNLSVTQSGTTLTSVQTTGSYQWIDCDNDNAPISGATNQTFNVTENGNYAVILTECGVSDTSECKLVDDLGIADNTLNLNVQLYPNPTNNLLTISVEGTQLTQLTITDLNGKILSQKTVSGNSAQSDVNNLSSGVYLIQINTENGKTVKRFVKE